VDSENSLSMDSILACEQRLNLTRTTATWRY
jgi:hypothetical protein